MVIARKHRLQASPNLKVGIGHYRDLLSLNASPKIEALKARRTKQKFGEKRHQCFISDLLFFFFRSTIHVVFVFQSLVLESSPKRESSRKFKLLLRLKCLFPSF